ncbi:N-6 DNA methylase [Serinibacter arcticus]|uniref:N-6 DNA methylase n=1 Tax=Serinibacter arcticus TaxID=1655435 RepID=A0A2U1ZVF2_9MICO|nr:RsmD family RNA methyltransferase [Serinibacter arcticus]PWD50966.1 N-6 DNA methylase [Serinibacter arcticus]
MTAATLEIVLQVLPGVAPALGRELQRAGLPDAWPRDPSDVDEELALAVAADPASLRALADLRTAVAAWIVLDSPAPRPTGLTATEVLRAFATTLELLARQRPRVRFTALRFEAAGSHTPQMQRVAAELAEVAGLPVDPDDGDLVVRARRARSGAGWELLVRTTARPLATRAWRTERYPGALNATIAAAVLGELARATPDGADAGRLVDLMCGSGTLVVERLARGGVEEILAVDVSPDAIATTAAHLRAARLRGRVVTRVADVRDLMEDDDVAGRFDAVVVNPPWGELLGEHAANTDLYAVLLDAVDRVGSARVRAGVLTHDIRRFEAVLAADPRWHLRARPQFFAKGHRPRLFVLERA